MKTMILNFYVTLLIISGCNTKTQTLCNKLSFKTISLDNFKIRFSIPQNATLVDTRRFSPERTLLNHKYVTEDSVFTLVVFVNKDYKEKERLDLIGINAVQKAEVASGVDSVHLISENFKQLDGIKVGYFKYWVRQNKNNYFSGRFFFQRDDKIIIFWLFENIDESIANSESIIDCIFDNIQLR